MKIDKTLLCKNIKVLIQESNKKTGDIEAQGGMAPGYLSKLLKDDSKNNNILDFVVTVASILGVTVESLVYTDLSELTPTERYLSDFIDKILKETSEGKLVWEKEPLSFFDVWENRARHPLFGVSNHEATEYCYNSQFGSCADITSDCYNVKIYYNYFYLMNVSIENNPNVYELYFVKSKDSSYSASDVTKICQIFPNTALFNIVEKLATAAAESASHIKIEDSARGIIDGFMQDIPF